MVCALLYNAQYYPPIISSWRGIATNSKGWNQKIILSYFIRAKKYYHHILTLISAGWQYYTDLLVCLKTNQIKKKRFE